LEERGAGQEAFGELDAGPGEVVAEGESGELVDPLGQAGGGDTGFLGKGFEGNVLEVL